MSDYGIKISLPGYAVQNALPHQCAIHSSYPCLKTKTGLDQGGSNSHGGYTYRPPGFWHFGTVVFNFVSDGTAGVDRIIYTVPHQYKYWVDTPYTPSCLVKGKYVSLSSGTMQGILPIEPTGTLSLYATTDEDNMYIWVRRDAGWGTMIGDTLTVNYMIFADNGA